jgi:hypothetical protein
VRTHKAIPLAVALSVTIGVALVGAYAEGELSNCRKIVQIHLTSREGSVTRRFEYSISALGGINREKAFADQRPLALATMVVSVLVFLIDRG